MVELLVLLLLLLLLVVSLVGELGAGWVGHPGGVSWAVAKRKASVEGEILAVLGVNSLSEVILKRVKSGGVSLEDGA